MKGIFQALMVLALIACIVLNIITLRGVNKIKEAAEHEAACRRGPYQGATCGSCTPGLPPIPGTGGPGQRGRIQ